MEQSTKKKPLIADFETEEKAIKAINHISKVCMIIGGIQILYAFSNEIFPSEAKIEMSIIGIILIGLGISLKKFKNRTIAKILLSLSLLWTTFSIISIAGLLSGGANTQIIGNPILGIAMIIASIQAVKATKKYNNKK